MRSYKALSKQLLGARYEQIRKSVLACIILYLALYTAEIRVAIAPFILYFTVTVFSAGVMWRALSSSQNREAMLGIFMLPFNQKALVFSYTLAFGTYVLMTKTISVLVILFAVGNWDIAQISLSILCACNACVMTAGIYAMTGQKKSLPAIVWTVVTGIVIVFIRQPMIVFVDTLVNLAIAIYYLSSANAYLFYRQSATQISVRHFRKKGGVFTYLFRYLLENKNYLMNTLGLWGIAAFLPFILGQFGGGIAMFMGLALVCLNTPICILLSCDPDLEQTIRVLPGQTMRFCSRYCLFIFFIHMLTSSIYLCSWQLQYDSVAWSDWGMAALFAFLASLLSALLEWYFPLRKWKVESDLWHHPRKYIVPVLLMLLAVLVSGYGR